MSQSIFSDIDPDVTSGTALATLLNLFKNAYATGQSGNTRPANAGVGLVWVSTAVADTLILMMYDGTNDVPLMSVDTITSSVSLISGGQQLISTSVDSVGAVLQFLKSRAGEQTLLNDNLGEHYFTGVDENDATITIAKIRVLAAEDTDSASAGSKVILEAVKIGTTTLIEFLGFDGTKVNLPLTTRLVATELDQQSIATTGTPITALDASKIIAMFTGSTNTEIQGIASSGGTGLTKSLLVHNKSTAILTFKHQDTNANAGDRLILPNGIDLLINPDESVEFFYDETAGRWKLQSGSGGGGGKYTVAAAQNTLAAGATITITALSRQLIRVAGSAPGNVLSSTPFGTTPGTQPLEILLVGHDNDNPVIIPYNDAANGCIGNFGAAEDGLEIRKDLPAKAIWNPDTSRFYVSRGV